ncbi:hypothetical protein BRADI_4g29794v3 [Brachypodium distachyon]|uniref:Uncharacterized protein n=1 Tax=Brachypodium distachyon TaxID=15368 RepID=A0A0Q3ERS5_BRADI|nr:hypothetical protein BRADI_4g29794v3 [Brachypodium distachyon]
MYNQQCWDGRIRDLGAGMDREGVGKRRPREFAEPLADAEEVHAANLDQGQWQEDDGAPIRRARHHQTRRSRRRGVRARGGRRRVAPHLPRASPPSMKVGGGEEGGTRSSRGRREVGGWG